ncbi:hypothetical protein LSTR_LSTR015550 [Laodelphax striatellus]|uniref:Uncharacterized protein n=1 Tax=Laodelphax striatellus TaxID=195883 RepID=A0A482XC00_LAOST|nr:hypothetical protein LSTR_LSTR015550 [Laodelphax striatellus]
MKHKRQAAYQSFCWLRNHYRGKQEAQSVGPDAAIETDLKRWMPRFKRKWHQEATGRPGGVSRHAQGNSGGDDALAIAEVRRHQLYAGLHLPPPSPRREGGPGMGPESYMMIFGLVLVWPTSSACRSLIGWAGNRCWIMSTGMSAVVQASSAYFYYVRQLQAMTTVASTWIPYMGLVMFAVSYR